MKKKLLFVLIVGVAVAFGVYKLTRTNHKEPPATSEGLLFKNETNNHRYDTFWKGSLKIARQQSGIEFGLILLKTLPPNQGIEDLAVHLFEQYGVAKATAGKGVLLVYVESEHAMKIEVGYALEPVFTDALTHRYEDAAKSFILSGNIADFMTEIMVTLVKHYELVTRDGKDDLWDFTPASTGPSLSRHFSGGAGVVGRGYAQVIDQSLTEIRSATKAQPRESLQPSADARETLDRYLASLEQGLGDPDLPLLTEGSRLFRIEYLKNSSYQKRTYDFYRRALPYDLQIKGELAGAIFRDDQPVWPIYMRKDPHGLWRIDEAGSWARNHLYENINRPFHKHEDDPFAFVWKNTGRWRSVDVLYPGRAKDFQPLSDPASLLKEIAKGEADLAAHPTDPDRYFALGDLLYFEAYWQEAAVHLYEKGLELAPARMEYRWRLVEIYPNLCEIEPWLAQYEEILRRTPGDSVADSQYRFQKNFYGPLMVSDTAQFASGVYEAISAPSFWPPRLNEAFPDVELRSPNGETVHLSSFFGQAATLIEPAGMNCPACNAFSGAHKKGKFGGIEPQGDLKSIEEYFDTANGVGTFRNRRLAFIQILLYSLKMGSVTRTDAEAWKNHYESSKPTVIIAGGPKLVNQASFDMIPGFYLLDPKGVVLSDSTGHHPRNDLYRHLLPMAGNLLLGSTSVRTLDSTEVARAYAWIPHHQTTYSAAISTLDTGRATSLTNFFRLVDLAIVARVHEMKELKDHRIPQMGESEYTSILKELQVLQSDANVPRPALNLVISAVEDQRAFLADWKGAIAKKEEYPLIGPRVTRSSESLHGAYNLLMQSFPNESAENKQAFFDHLCALDFK